MIVNESAKLIFDNSIVDNISPVNEYPIWRKQDQFGRTYYGVSHFWNMDNSIDESTDLSWLEWDGNEIHIDGTENDNIMSVFTKAVGIAKAWSEQMKRDYTDEQFIIIASFDDGS